MKNDAMIAVLLGCVIGQMKCVAGKINQMKRPAECPRCDWHVVVAFSLFFLVTLSLGCSQSTPARFSGETASAPAPESALEPVTVSASESTS
ncbi:MAG: hypothetical protein AAF745_16980, partial [Planctomycetota bacterium]